ncbi:MULTISPECIES: ATP-binding protein [unclassified Rubrivivax]|uniref:sensor histidine kinase n=1 Tax=unclassified Rubrivivax TaxID=2649762 RepID=UPI0013E91CF2|nr:MULTISPECIES: ATP-binding protein [unclassified Rubrivivax]MCC9596519.1 PAS domain S-box protein [Rubrivivax sp. JA1055]MCC9648675.1 PAS domain S-box protein [Rubrivivax sp. JA1029]MCD0422390.1 PAS domain S-box protein [Rubrivivax sp. JA1024]
MNRPARWIWIVALVAGIGAALVLAFVLSLSTAGGGFYERHFVWLFWVNAAVAALLVLVIGVAAVRLVLRLKRGKFGSRLLIKLAGIFALVGVLPGLVIYAVSYQFVSRSIDAWFDVKVAGALDAGLALGKTTLDALQADVAGKARLAAERLGDSRQPSPLVLERLREQTGVREIALLNHSGQILATAGVAPGSSPPERPPTTLLRQARSLGVASQIEGLDDEALSASDGAGGAPRLRALALLPDASIRLSPGDDRFLMVVQPLPRKLAVDALAVQAAHGEYQQRALARDSLSRMYIGTLTLALILAVFGAVLLAILLGNQLARPLLLLADGMRQVAAGDLKPKPVFASGDELGGLTRSFADMTAQLADAREQVQRGVDQLEGARTRLQTILDTLTAGVIVFDREGCIDTVNPGATRILGLSVAAWRGRHLGELPELEGFARSVEQRYEQLADRSELGGDHWQDAFELARPEGVTLTLLVRGAPLPGEQRLMVFDDITEVVSAQRSQAWAEVARRLAHEIKNPLTPIQLSAERLQHRLESKLEGSDQALLLRSVATIVAQVDAMQRLVNEFRDYARLPAAQMKPLDLNALANEVLALYGQAHDRGQLVVRLTEPLPRILGDATQIRQVIHNLVQNALDAVSERADGRVEIGTARSLGDNGELRAVRLFVQDNGPGFPDKVLKRAFEPYVTTKAKGTGLGLAVVKKIADEHHARLRAVNMHLDEAPESPVTGARVSLSFSLLAPAPNPETDGGPATASGDATQVL